MTREQERIMWSAVLAAYGAQRLEQMICGHLDALLSQVLIGELPGLVSVEGLAQLAGVLFANIESGERPLLGAHRTMNRIHFCVLRQIKKRLSFLLLADLPFDLVPTDLRKLRAQIDFGV